MRLLVAKSVNRQRLSLLDYVRFSVRKGLFGSFVLPEEEVAALEAVPLRKAVIQTPTTAGGKISWKAVPVGASIWVTVKRPDSPLHGRHILITKRPDGQFALTGGAGWNYVDGEETKRVRAHKHMVMQAGEELKRQKRDIELEEEYERVKKLNEPVKAKLREIQKQSRKQFKQSREAFLGSVGITKKQLSKEELADIKATAKEHALKEGAEEGKAEMYADFVAKAAKKRDTEWRERVGIQRKNAALLLERFRAKEEGKLKLEETREKEEAGGAREESSAEQAQQALTSPAELPIMLPAIPSGDVTPQEMEHAVARGFDEAIGNAVRATQEGQELPEVDGEKPSVTLGAGLQETQGKVLEAEKPEKAKEAISSYEEMMRTRAEERALRKQLRKLPEMEILSPAGVEQLRIEAKALSKEELDRVTQEYEHAHRMTDDNAFYSAVSEHWNDKVGYRLNGDCNKGAASAISALGGKYLGERFDVKRLVDNIGIEGASMAIAFRLRREMSAEDFDRLIDRVTEHNAANQEKMETRAMEEHRRLVNEYKEIQRQKTEETLQSKATIEMLETENLLAQRKNLGTALGSLEASAGFLAALEVAKTAKDNAITINVGEERKAAEQRMEALGLKEGKRAKIVRHPQLGWQIRTSARGLRRYITRIEKDRKTFRDWEATKENTSDTAGYLPPSFKNEFYNEAAERTEPIKMRIEQRNDIEWLDKAGGGVITRVTGAGKTLTAYGFFAKQIQRNPQYKAVAVVPKGRVDQWVREAQNFTNLNVVKIPEGTSQEERAKIYAREGKGGAVFVTSHRDGSFDGEMIEAVGVNGIVIDEPQELKSKASYRRSAAARRLMKIKAENRIGLTATLAREHPVEAYNIVNWANPGALGFRTRFERSFSGFGAGTNAQDAALQDMLWKEISPFVSGGRLTHPDYKVNHSEVTVSRGSDQIAMQKEIESKAQGYIRERIAAVPQEKRTGHWRVEARRKALEEISQQHRDNFAGGNKTAKFIDTVKKYNREGRGKHVIFVESSAQRRAVVDSLTQSGYKQNQIKNITGIARPAEVEKRKQMWKKGREVPFIIIDKTSAAGHNLQEGDVLHVLGAPEDAAQYLQAQGRVARSPRKGDVDIATYRYADNPWEDLHWDKLNAQLKLLRATAPGLFKSVPISTAARRPSSPLLVRHIPGSTRPREAFVIPARIPA